jgi:hypothetical protein
MSNNYQRKNVKIKRIKGYGRQLITDTRRKPISSLNEFIEQAPYDVLTKVSYKDKNNKPIGKSLLFTDTAEEWKEAIAQDAATHGCNVDGMDDLDCQEQYLNEDSGRDFCLFRKTCLKKAVLKKINQERDERSQYENQTEFGELTDDEIEEIIKLRNEQ